MSQLTARPATRVVEALAERAGVDPAELSPPLSTAVDPDALNKLVADADDGVAVRFEYADDEVVVRSDGRVAVQ
ncbi:HalOD1 output domain-containing protein [Halolamina rubra]|uniref:HalOD1 output domain-containing protein n=1 Tax=Halolamina rubra TaxID=1380430 RepID=UPI0006785489|nr:HalOD1 output domain-containing protein [Halolamina rubra]